jgi:hypothetical protein
MDCEIHEGIWHYIQMHAVMYVRSQQQKEVAAFPENKPLGTHSNQSSAIGKHIGIILH